ncbi:MAG: serine/threonine protein kinase [Bacteroidota bacterium]|nr:serine/threonine protein kinase [Bacteroidota bacterium]
MVKYRLSKNINILNPSEYLEIINPADQLEGRYILSDQSKDRDFLINETVKYFIEKFSVPKTQANVLQEVAEDVQSDVKKIEKQCTAFLKFLCKRKIVVPENWEEPIISNEPLFKIGDCINEWCLNEVIASKKYIEIYLATHKTSNQECVIKLLNKNKIANKEYYEDELLALKHEYSMLQRVGHIPFVGQAYALCENGSEGAYIILEYIKGKALPTFLNQAEGITESDCLDIINNILQGFALLHEANLIHGDIHPSNIMVNEDRTIKIIDLGLSLDVNIEQDEIIKFGGVTFYMPPERINISSVSKFSREPDFYSDVYQLGLIIYYILYKTEPFDGFIWEELSRNIKKNKVEYPALSFLNFPVPAKIIKVMAKCLQKNPKKRYATAGALLADFKKVVLESEVFTS